MRDWIFSIVVLVATAALGAAQFVINPFVFGGGGGGESPTVLIAEDFNTDNSADWTAVTGSAWTWNHATTEDLSVTANSQYLYTGGTLASTSQWAYMQISAVPTSHFIGVVLKATNNGSEPAYAFRFNSNTNMELRTITGSGGTNTIYPWARVINANDYFGFTVSGSGDSTVFHLFDFGPLDPGAFVDIATWQTAADADQEVSSSNWEDNEAPANSGTYAGVYNGAAGTGPEIDNFRAGTYVP